MAYPSINGVSSIPTGAGRNLSIHLGQSNLIDALEAATQPPRQHGVGPVFRRHARPVIGGLKSSDRSKKLHPRVLGYVLGLQYIPAQWPNIVTREVLAGDPQKVVYSHGVLSSGLKSPETSGGSPYPTLPPTPLPPNRAIFRHDSSPFGLVFFGLAVFTKSTGSYCL